MGWFLNSVRDEYDDDGNYIGNSPGGNKFHGVKAKPEENVRLLCMGCGHVGGTYPCAKCGCAEQKQTWRHED